MPGRGHIIIEFPVNVTETIPPEEERLTRATIVGVPGTVVSFSVSIQSAEIPQILLLSLCASIRNVPGQNKGKILDTESLRAVDIVVSNIPGDYGPFCWEEANGP
ncbi:hypothetical protein LTR43_012220 [Exophiala xenobiotica]|nr:hypothetical protein LTR55_012216 [Exophiala xenobiotica]